MSKNTPENKNLKPKTSRINLNTINSILNLAQIDLHVRLTQSNQANKRHAPSGLPFMHLTEVFEP